MSQATFTDGIGYEGKVTLTLRNNDQVLKTKIYKNKGTAQLFKFLGYCLIDSYEEAKRLLPNKIMLLQNISSDDPDAADPTLVMSQSLFRGLAQTPTIVSDNVAKQVRVTYSFEIPRAAIEGPFNQIALYGAGMTETDIADFSAYYFLRDAYGAFEVLDPTTDSWSATTVLLVEWELSISNRIEEQGR